MVGGGFGIGAVELVLALLMFAGGSLGLPVSVPPLPADPLIERSAPQECLLHVATRGIAEPSGSSTNLTERLLANEEVRRFVGELTDGVLTAMKTSPGVRGPAAEAVDQGIVVLGTLFSQPASLTVSKLSIDQAAGPPSVDAALVVKCGDRAQAVKEAIEKLLGMVFAGAPEAMQPKPVTIAGRAWSKVDLPIVGPVTWGFGGAYFVVTVGNDATERLLDRLGGKSAKAPAWKAKLEERMPRERLATLTYVDARAAMKIVQDLPKLGGPAIPEGVLEATGLSKLETIGAVTGLTAEGFAASLWLGIDGEPTGIFAVSEEGVGGTALRTVPRDAIMAQLLKLDLARAVASAFDLFERVNPSTAVEARQGLERLGGSIGMNVVKEILEPIGSDWSFFIVPGGGFIPAMALQVSLDDRAAFEKAHDRLLGMAVAEAGERAVTVRKINYHGHTIHCLKAGVETPLPATPSWCLAKDRLVVTASPQLMKTLLARGAGDEGLDSVPELKRATASGGESMIGYLEPSALMSTLFSVYEMGSPLVESGLARQRITVRMPELPAAAAVMPHVRPSVTVVRRVKGTGGGILFDSTSTVPLGPLSSGGGLVGGAPMSAPVLVGLLLPAVQSARQAARRTQAMNNARQIVLAILVHESVKRRLPAPAICDKEGKPLLSWRVAMLPYLEEQGLYNQFRLNEPWDSEHNKKLVPLMPPVFQDPGLPEQAGGGLTTFQVLRGEKSAFPKDAEGLQLGAISDGTSKTIAVVEVSGERAVPWTKPEDLAFDPDKPFDGLGTDRRPGGLFIAAFLDGHVETLSPDVPPEVLKAMVTRAADDRVPE